MSFCILGTGHSVPEKVVTNDDLTTFLETSDEWIIARSGVRQRYICTKETTADLAVQAAKAALENSQTDVDEIDLILCATTSGQYVVPSLSCLVQERLNAHCPCLDVNAACTAFIYLLDTAAAFFSRGGIRKMLVIGAESMSRILNWHDRSTCILFGDGAGAVVLGPGENYQGACFETRGGSNVIFLATPDGASPWQAYPNLNPFLHMDGPKTYKFAINSLHKRLEEILQKTGYQESDIDWVVPHQANRRIIENVAKQMKGILADRFCINIDRYANTSSASIPIVLDEWNRTGRFQRGDLIAIVGFGGGLSSGACMIRW